MPRTRDAARAAELRKLGDIVAGLNEQGQEGGSLRLYVDGWLAANRHFRRWQKTNPDLDSIVQNVMTGTHYLLLSSSDGRAQPYVRFYSPIGNKKPVSEKVRYACLVFIDVVSSPLRDRLGKCDRCDRYYVSERAYVKKRFCSRRCAKSEFAAKATQRRRNQERKQKHQDVTRAIRAMESRQLRPLDWKEWVSKRAGVTKKWITRAINSGVIRPPEAGENQKGTKKRGLR